MDINIISQFYFSRNEIALHYSLSTAYIQKAISLNLPVVNKFCHYFLNVKCNDILGLHRGIFFSYNTICICLPWLPKLGYVFNICGCHSVPVIRATLGIWISWIVHIWSSKWKEQTFPKSKKKKSNFFTESIIYFPFPNCFLPSWRANRVTGGTPVSNLLGQGA